MLVVLHGSTNRMSVCCGSRGMLDTAVRCGYVCVHVRAHHTFTPYEVPLMAPFAFCWFLAVPVCQSLPSPLCPGVGDNFGNL